MKGLLTKDFRILAGQKRYFTIIILIALIFLCSGQPAQIIVGYCTMFGMLFTVNTISYDEFDHGYLVSVHASGDQKRLCAGKICIYAAVRRWFLGSFRSGRFCGRLYPGRCGVSFRMADAHVLILLEMIIFLAVMLPVSLKYGMEKSRTATMILGFAVLGAAIAARKLLPENFAGGLRWSAQLNPAAVTAVVFLVSLATLAVSFAGSIRIMQKKVF